MIKYNPDLSPCFFNDCVIEPEPGYFILPKNEIVKFNDRYALGNIMNSTITWVNPLTSIGYYVGNKIDNQLRCFSRKINDDIGLFERMEKYKRENMNKNSENKENPANFVVNVGKDNKQLIQIIIDLLKKYDFIFYNNPYSSGGHQFRILRENWFCRTNQITYYKNSVHYFPGISDYIQSHPEDYLPEYDGFTQFGEIVRLLETPLKEKKQPPIINGYKMEYNIGDAWVIFGCAVMSREMIEDTLIILNKIYCGNGKISSITLDCGVILTRYNLKEIIDYIDYVNHK